MLFFLGKQKINTIIHQLGQLQEEIYCKISTGKSPAKGCEDDEGTGTSPVCTKAERSGEEKVRGGLFYIYKYLKGECKEVEARLFSSVPSTRTRDSRHKPEPWTSGRTFLWGCLSTACIGRLWSLLLGDPQKLLGQGPGHIALGGPAWAVDGIRWTQRSLPNCSAVILWKYFLLFDVLSYTCLFRTPFILVIDQTTAPTA